MNRYSGIILCWSYVIGLLGAVLLSVRISSFLWLNWIILVIGLGILGIVAAIVIPQFWRTGPRWHMWLIAGVIAAVAVLYFQMSIPQPGVNDISLKVAEVEGNVSSKVVIVKGQISQQPRLTQSQRVQFWLKVEDFKTTEGKDEGNSSSQTVTGNLYVTVPLLQGTGLYPRQKLTVTGILYQPQSASNPGTFDFRAYLARHGAFAGLNGLEVNWRESDNLEIWGLWRIRQRIIRSQVQWLGSPAGQLVSSMVLGRRAVDLPYDVRNQFIKAGLAHVLAASGFHVSLLLGLVVGLTRRFSWRSQFIIGLSTLAIYVSLTGAHPSVLRAALMGVGALFALAGERKLRRLSALLLVATFLLLCNPLWILDLGFQLSFLATLGLIVTVPVVQKQLDWVPPTLATVVSIPLAATLWTLPLLMHVFNVVAIYTIPVNIIATPLIILISLGGMVSALAALIYPLAGSAIAWLLYYPTHLLIGIVDFFTLLPGSSLAVGKITLLQMLAIYGLICLVWLSKWWQPRWWLVGLFATTLVVIPLWHSQLTKIQVTVLATKKEQVLVIQNQGKVILINSGEADSARFTVLPFLAQEAINQLDCAVAFNSEYSLNSGWSQILTNLSVKTFVSSFPLESISSYTIIEPKEYQPLLRGRNITVGLTMIKLISNQPPMLQLKIGEQNWLLLSSREQEEQIVQDLLTQASNINPKVFLWSGSSLKLKWFSELQPKEAIASSVTVTEDIQKYLKQQNIQLYWTGRDGAIQWTPSGGFTTTLEMQESEASLL